MDVSTVLTQLVQNNSSFPAMKLVWNCQLLQQQPSAAAAEAKALSVLPKISPSHYNLETSFSTGERLALLCQQQKRLEFWGPGLEFSVVPSMVVFQQYKGGDEPQSVAVTIRNISRHTQKVQLRLDETSVFSLDHKSARVAKFASAMTISATIKFTPQDDLDYFHKFVVSTDHSSFSIPILAIGARAVLDLPDEISFGRVAVKYVKEVGQIVSNTGSKEAKFTLSTDGPFSVTPEKGVIAPNDSFNLSVSCYCESIGEVSGHLCVKFDNGEEMYTSLSAELVNEDVHVSPTHLQFPDTYMGFKSSQRLTITNNSSNTVLKFSWKGYGVRHQRQSSLGSTVSMFNMIRRSIVDSSALPASERRATLVPGELHAEPVLKPEPLYHNKNFAIEPMTGEIQPKSSAEFQILFTPTEAMHYETNPYLDITGQEERVPVRICGEGLGPKFKFGFSLLDLGDVYLGGGHSYEIPVTNISEIKGNILYEGVAGLWPGVNIRVEPRKVKLAPGHFSAFYASFTCAGTPGPFLEELQFRVPATDHLHTVVLRGTLQFPKLRFLNPTLEFGQVAYGFARTEQILLRNDTLNQVEINLVMDQDGGVEEPAIGYEEIISRTPLSLPLNPKEFSIEPSSFTLQPKGYQRILVTILANNYGEYRRQLLVCVGESVEDASEEEEGDPEPVPVHSLPVFAYAPVPEVSDTTTDQIHGVYVGLASAGEFEILNASNLPGIYQVIPKFDSGEEEDGGGKLKVLLESDYFTGILKAGNVTRIPYKITCNFIGEATVHAELYLVGNEEKILDLHVHAHSSPSKLEANVKMVDFGAIEVSEWVEETFEMANDSPLTVDFKTILIPSQVANYGAEWQIEPETGTLEPFEKTSISVRVKLAESGGHGATIRVQMLGLESNTFIEVKVKAIGVGTSLEITEAGAIAGEGEGEVVDISVINFGTIFTKSGKVLSFKVKNTGYFTRALEWKPVAGTSPVNEKVKRKKPGGGEEETLAMRKARERKEKAAKAKKLQKSNFRMDPSAAKLNSWESTLFNFRAVSDKPKVLEEEFVLWAYTPYTAEDNIVKRWNPRAAPAAAARGAGAPGGIPDPKELAHTPTIARRVVFRVEFVTPKLSFSKKSLVFRIEANPYDDDVYEQRLRERAKIRVENNGSLPIPAIFRTEFPFSMVLRGIDPKLQLEEDVTAEEEHTEAAEAPPAPQVNVDELEASAAALEEAPFEEAPEFEEEELEIYEEEAEEAQLDGEFETEEEEEEAEEVTETVEIEEMPTEAERTTPPPDDTDRDLDRVASALVSAFVDLLSPSPHAIEEEPQALADDIETIFAAPVSTEMDSAPASAEGGAEETPEFIPASETEGEGEGESESEPTEAEAEAEATPVPPAPVRSSSAHRDSTADGQLGSEYEALEWSHTFLPNSHINLMVRFDGRHVQTDKGSVAFNSKLNVLVQGHPDVDFISLSGQVHFPSVECSIPDDGIDFGVIPNGAEAVETFTLTNVCNFCLTYKWFIRPNSTYIKQKTKKLTTSAAAAAAAESLDQDQEHGTVKQKIRTPVTPPAPPSTARTTTADFSSDELQLALTGVVGPHCNCSQILLHDGVHLHTDKDAKEESEAVRWTSTTSATGTTSEDEWSRMFSPPSATEEFGNSISMTRLNLLDPSVQLSRNRLHRDKFMEIVGLQDPDPLEEAMDDLQYLQTFAPYRPPVPMRNLYTSPGSDALNIAEIIDITPLSGVIQAGQQQTFSVIFYGHNWLRFKTMLTCCLEGGSSTHVLVTGRSSKATHDMLYPKPKAKSLIPVPIAPPQPPTPRKFGNNPQKVIRDPKNRSKSPKVDNTVKSKGKAKGDKKNQ